MDVHKIYSPAEGFLLLVPKAATSPTFQFVTLL